MLAKRIGQFFPRSIRVGGYGVMLALGACGSSAADTAAAGTTAVTNSVAGTGVTMANGVAKVAMSGCAAFDYLAPFSVGGQTLYLLVDSGSTSVAVAGSSCSTCGTSASYKLSSTGQALGKQSSSEYLDGSAWEGSVYQDKIALGASSSLATPQVDVDFAVITEQKEFFEQVTCSAEDDTPYDGILGVGPDDLLTQYTTSFLTELNQSGALKSDLFALQTCDVGGTMWVGGYDSNAMSGEPNFTPMVSTQNASSDGAYAINVSGIGLGNTSLNLTESQMGPIVVDNGTSTIILKTQAYQAFEQTIENNAAYISNFGSGFISASNGQCQAASQGLTRAQIDAQLPPLTMTFPTADGNTFTVSLPATSSYLVAGTVSGDASGTVFYCPAITEDSSTTIFGNVAMRSLITVFDRANNQIGFAPQVGCTQKEVLYLSGT